ncbi:hypothetical protein [Desulfofundulus thermosubterraneus]|uniref:hypothetical protein n=1 Tax=Desulfofundulus thermosubterraneus TaxID=348840 RepID=UPI000935273D|nr:hypothetical protein [Desulfofundulus thermosubterraneus]
MGVSFTEPLWWLALPVILAAAWYLRLPWLQMARLAGRGPWRREIFRVAFRFAILILLVAVLAGPHLVMPVQRRWRPGYGGRARLLWSRWLRRYPGGTGAARGNAHFRPG